MKKTISLFQRNYGGDRLVRDEIVPGAVFWDTEDKAKQAFDAIFSPLRELAQS
jgi:hypothetical protein